MFNKKHTCLLPLRAISVISKYELNINLHVLLAQPQKIVTLRAITFQNGCNITIPVILLAGDLHHSILKNSAFDLCDFNIIKQLIALTKETTLRSIGQRVSRLNFNESSENFWTIDSSLPSKDPLIIGFVNHYKLGQEKYMDPEYTYNGAIYVIPLNAHTDTKALKNYRPRTGRWYGSTSHPEDSFARIGLSSIVSCSTEDRDGEDVWSYTGVQANTLTDEVGQLGIRGLTQDLFILYLLALANPCLSGSGEDPFEENVDDAKCRGVLPLAPKHRLWYDLWRLLLSLK